MNTKNNQFQSNLLPSLVWTKWYREYLLAAMMDRDNKSFDTHLFVAKSDDNLDKDIQNLKLYFPALNVTCLPSK
jgi:hypothetical protein